MVETQLGDAGTLNSTMRDGSKNIKTAKRNAKDEKHRYKVLLTYVYFACQLYRLLLVTESVN